MFITRNEVLSKTQQNNRKKQIPETCYEILHFKPHVQRYSHGLTYLHKMPEKTAEIFLVMILYPDTCQIIGQTSLAASCSVIPSSLVLDTCKFLVHFERYYTCFLICYKIKWDLLFVTRSHPSVIFKLEVRRSVRCHECLKQIEHIFS